MITHHFVHRVRYRECDRMGLVYHPHFLDYFEWARTELLREHGLTYKETEDSGILIQVVEVRVRYHRPAYYDDELDIKTIVEAPPAATLDLVNEVRRVGEDEKIATGWTKLCFVSKDRGRPVRAPKNFIEALTIDH